MLAQQQGGTKMSAITVTIENLKDGSIRATARHNGRTVSWKDGVNAKALLAEVMDVACYEHRVGNEYDFTYIQLNDAAKLAMALKSYRFSGQ